MQLSAMGMSLPYRQALAESGLRDMLEQENIAALAQELRANIPELAAAQQPENKPPQPAEKTSGSGKVTAVVILLVLIVPCTVAVKAKLTKKQAQ